ncbi:variable large family protein (plasmid) [Borrelia turicatae]|nr:variable large family protein [Borrelia turicatae]UPA15718.1 variable large family protein [Borrelia turicatae]
MAVESKISFFASLIKIGHGFQEIFGIFGNAIGDTLGFTAVKSGDKRSKVGEHFKTIGDGLTTTKKKLNELSGKISEAKNADGSSIEAVKGAIKGANDVFEQLIAALTKLASVSKEANVDVGDNASNAAAVAADANSVKTIIENVKEIIQASEKSGVKINEGDAGGQVAGGAATAGTALAKSGAAAGAGATAKLADEVSKADPWAMINKIKDANTDAQLTVNAATNEVGALATKIGDDANVGAKTNADLAAAVALKAMTKGGKSNEADAVKAAAVTAVNKVLGVLDFIIRKTISINLDKIRETVKGIQYSETTTEATEASTTTQPAAAK